MFYGLRACAAPIAGPSNLMSLSPFAVTEAAGVREVVMAAQERGEAAMGGLGKDVAGVTLTLAGGLAVVSRVAGRDMGALTGALTISGEVRAFEERLEHHGGRKQYCLLL